MLEALRGRGGFAREGDGFSRFVLELLGTQLHIFGTGEWYINAAHTDMLMDEYHYYLEEAEAARLLDALREDYGAAEPPERILPREFEFARPGCPLYEYLDAHQIAYVYITGKISL